MATRLQNDKKSVAFAAYFGRQQAIFQAIFKIAYL